MRTVTYILANGTETTSYAVAADSGEYTVVLKNTPEIETPMSAKRKAMLEAFGIVNDAHKSAI